MKMFISYCHEDSIYCSKLQKHLTTLCEEYDIEIEIDENILPGEKFKQKILEGLDKSQIVLLLMSTNYLASAACREEMKIAMKNMETKETSVIPIIVSDCDWQKSEVGEQIALPHDGKAISNWENEDSAYSNIVKGLRKNVDKQMGNELQESFKKKLQETEFKNDSKNCVTLCDIFVHPYIVENHENSRTTTPTLKQLMSTPEAILFYGESQSGKSAICKQIYLMRINDNKLSLLLNGSDLKQYSDSDKLLKTAFSEQYTGKFGMWESSNDRMIIIDDYKFVERASLINKLKKDRIKIIISVSTNEFISDYRKDKSLATARKVRIQEFSHSQQEKLIRKWNAADSSLHLQEDNNDAAVDKAENLINSIISRHKIVPRFPFYILTILQSMAAIVSQDLKITRFGHVYQALLTSQLITFGIKAKNIDSVINILAYSAFRQFDNARNNRNQLSVDSVVADYEKTYILNNEALKLFFEFSRQQLAVNSDELSFQNRYIYYYLLGLYFANHRDDFGTIAQDLVLHSHTRENSHILIFTIHHSNDNELINLLISHAQNLFSGEKLATLSTEDTLVLRPVLSDIPKRLLSSKSVQEERQIEREHRDRAEQEYLQQIDSEDDFDGGDIYSAVRSMEVLGQVVLNKYGSMEREYTENIIGVVCDLALKVVNRFLSIGILEDLERLIDNEHKSDECPYKQFRLRVLYGLSRQFRLEFTIIVYLLIMKAAAVLGEFDLVEVFKRVRNRNASPAYRLIYCVFILGATECLDDNVCNVLVKAIDRFKNEGNEIAERLLSIAVQQYFNTHVVNFRVRQRICGALGIRLVVSKPPRIRGG